MKTKVNQPLRDIVNSDTAGLLERPQIEDAFMRHPTPSSLV